MSTPVTAPIDLDRTRHLRLSWREIKTFEQLYHQRTGQKLRFMEFVAKQADWTVEDMAILAFACLSWEDPDLTEDSILDLFGIGEQMRLNTLIGELLLDSLPEEAKKKLAELREKEAAAEAAKATSPPGTSSSLSPGE